MWISTLFILSGVDIKVWFNVSIVARGTNMWTIKEISKLTGLAPATLRYYDKMEILPSKRLENGYRVYDELDLLIIQNLVVLKYAGFPLDDIKVLTSLYYKEEGDECNEMGREVFDRQLKTMKQKIDMLQEVIKIIESIQPLFETHELYKINQEDLYQRIQGLFQRIQEKDFDFLKVEEDK